MRSLPDSCRCVCWYKIRPTDLGHGFARSFKCDFSLWNRYIHHTIARYWCSIRFCRFCMSTEVHFNAPPSLTYGCHGLGCNETFTTLEEFVLHTWACTVADKLYCVVCKQSYSNLIQHYNSKKHKANAALVGEGDQAMHSDKWLLYLNCLYCRSCGLHTTKKEEKGDTWCPQLIWCPHIICFISIHAWAWCGTAWTWRITPACKQWKLDIQWRSGACNVQVKKKETLTNGIRKYPFSLSVVKDFVMHGCSWLYWRCCV